MPATGPPRPRVRSTAARDDSASNRLGEIDAKHSELLSAFLATTRSGDLNALTQLLGKRHASHDGRRPPGRSGAGCDRGCRSCGTFPYWRRAQLHNHLRSRYEISSVSTCGSIIVH